MHASTDRTVSPRSVMVRTDGSMDRGQNKAAGRPAKVTMHLHGAAPHGGWIGREGGVGSRIDGQRQCMRQ